MYMELLWCFERVGYHVVKFILDNLFSYRKISVDVEKNQSSEHYEMYTFRAVKY